MRKILLVAILLACVTLGYNIAYTYSTGAPTGHTGAPGQSNCLSCHSSTVGLNAGPEVPQISIAGNPTQYSAGQTYVVTVSFTSTTRPRHGFSMTALNASNQNAGSWGVINAATSQVNAAGGITYVTHTSSGTFQTSWSFNWTAPATNVGNVTFYAAFNAANGNNNNTGDNIYTQSHTLSFSSVVPNAISTSITGTSFCAGSAINVGFTASGTYTAGNVFTAQLSNATGSFASPVSIGTLAGTTSGTIAATIPAGTTAGTGYRIRVIASTPSTTGTSNTANLTISTMPTVAATAAATTLCSGQTTTLTATGATTYSWSTGQTGSVITVSPTSTTTYSVTGTNGACSSAAAVTVNVNPAPATPTASTNAPVCAGTLLQLSASSGAPTATYSWVGPNSFSSSLQNPTITSPTVANSGTYTVYVLNNGCVSQAAFVSAIVNGVPNAPSISTNAPVCAGATLQLSATAGFPSAGYSWVGPNSFSSAQQNPSITNVTASNAGNYTAYALSNGCVSPASILTVSVQATPAAPSASAALVCQGQTLTLSASGQSGAGFSWTGPGNYTSAVQNPAIANATGANGGVYTVTQTLNGCTSLPDTITATVHALPVISVTPTSATVCTSQSATLQASGADTYTWTPASGLNATTGATVVATPAANTTYTVTGQNSQGCPATATAVVQVASTLNVTATATPATICAGQSTNLTASGATSYSWSNGQTGQIISVAPAVTTLYSVVGSSGACSDAATVTVAVNPVPVVGGLADTTICEGSAVPFTATGAATYSWSNGQTGNSITVTPTASATYSVVGTALGCSDTATVAVTVNQLPQVSFTGLDALYCATALPTSPLSGNPTGGTFSGTGISGNVFTPSSVGPGTYTITYTYADANGCSNTASQQTEVSICGGIADQNPEAIRLYPNPSTGNLTLELQNSNGQTVEILLYNTLGQQVWQTRQTVTNAGIGLQLPTYVTSGFYQARVVGEQGFYTIPVQLNR